MNLIKIQSSDSKSIRLLKRVRLVVLVVLLAGLLWWSGDILYRSVSLWNVYREGRTLAAGGITSFPLAQAPGLLARADRHLGALHRDLQPVYALLRFGSGLPAVGGQLAQVQPGMAYANNLVHAAALVAGGLEPSLQMAESGAGVELLAGQALADIQQAQPALEAAAAALERAASARAQIQPGFLPERLRQPFTKYDAYFPYLQTGLTLLRTLPDLLGGAHPATYLVLAQNRDELRASGGFITALGVFNLVRGADYFFDISDSYQVDDFSKSYPPPPEPLSTYMLSGLWLARDANWSPDFPTAARQAQSLYQLSTGQETQGVIAFDQEAVVHLLSVTGPLHLVGQTEPITPANVEQYMHAAWAPAPQEGFSREWWLNRKQFIADLGKALVKSALSLGDREKMILLGRVFLDDLRAGHLLLYFNQPEAQAVLTNLGLDHAVKPGDADYLFVVDSNIGFNKVDAVIQRRLDYQVDLRDPAQPTAQLAVLYTHTLQVDTPCKHEAEYSTTYEDMHKRCYWNYWRVLTPPGSQLRDSSVQAVPGERLLSGESYNGQVSVETAEGGAQQFAGLLVLPSGQTQPVVLGYALPAGVAQVDDQRLVYRLKLRKQPGVSRVMVSVSLRLPPGWEDAAYSEGWAHQAGSNLWVWEQILTRDMDLELALSKP